MDRTVRSYPSDLTDVQWEAVRHLIPAGKPIGADRKTSMRAVVNAILYRRRSGCPWRMLPHDFPHWRTVYGYFRQWQHDGTWPQIEAAQQRVRCTLRELGDSSLSADGRAAAPSQSC
jgi:putative transposase